MITKTVWGLILLTGGALDDCKCNPVVKREIARFWTKEECTNRIEKYNSADGKAKLTELAGGNGWALTCDPREAAIAP